MNRIPLTVEIEDAIRLAILARAAKEGASPSDVVNAALRKALAAEIDEASGVPPLATVIQNHHDREQEVLRQQSQAPRPQGGTP
jgi:hypothetical protein